MRKLVGVIDSGVGGLTILKQLQVAYPQCDYIYIADGAYCPYGTKQPHEIFRRVYLLVYYLKWRGVTSVIIACNTASTYVERLRRMFPFPIHDVIAPTCHLIADVTECRRVALLATDATVDSGIYQRTLLSYGIDTVAYKCSSFVPFVEANAVNTPQCEQTVRHVLQQLPLANIDTVILGCTHFPLLRKQITQCTGNAKVVECTTDFTIQHALRFASKGHTLYLTTGCPNNTNAASRWFSDVNFKYVNIP